MKNPSKYPVNRIREVREGRGLTQEQLAEMVGTTNQQIGRLENRERRLTWEWMQRISSALESHPMDLVESSPASASSDEQQLLERYRLLSPDERKTIHSMTDYLAEKALTFKNKKP